MGGLATSGFEGAQLGGPAIPVVDLLGQPFLHRRQGLVDQRLAPLAHAAQVARHQLGDGVGDGPGFQLFWSAALRSAGVPFVVGRGAVVEIGRAAADTDLT